MNRKRFIQILIFLTIFSMFSIAVYAQTGARLTETFASIGKLLFEDFGSMGAYGFKFLLWIALFSLFDYGLKKGKFEKKVASTIAFVLSLASVIMIPGEAIKKIFALYSYIIIMCLGVFVPLILFWVVHKNFKGDTVGERLIRAFAFGLVGGALLWFTANASDWVGKIGVGVII
ncbi:hypothetical protein GOV06_01520 [Candidatus Woesearchaeota archaeon]|nr:hypothetical protein [Candidatus Woesearchaeota archaeon]